MLRFVISTKVYAGFLNEEPRIHHLQELYVSSCKGCEWSDQVFTMNKVVNEAKTVGVLYLSLSKIFDKMLYGIYLRENQGLGINAVTC